MKKALERIPKPFFEYRDRLVQHVVRARDLAGRSGGQVLNEVAGRECHARVERANRQAALAAAAHIGLDLGARRGRCGRGLVFQSPFLLGTINLTEIVDAGVLL